jgi:V8-like Glu-specific endopeptidase
MFPFRGRRKFMQNQNWRCFSKVIAVTAVALLVVSFTTLAVAQGAGETIRMSTKGTEAGATLAYWTPQRLAAAVPMKMARPSTGAVRMAAPPVASGTPRRAGGYSAVTGQMNEDASAIAGANVPLDGSYPGPHDTFYYGPKYNTYPIKTVGKLYFHDPVGGGNFQCTATVTTGSASIKNIIWTAGHCVANGGQAYFYNSFLFCPEYNNGATPVGCWAYSGGSVFSAWYYNGDLTYDEGVLSLQHKGTVRKTDVANVTGGLGFAWNWGRDQTAAEHRYDVNIGGAGPYVNSWGSGQTEGSSGSAVQLFHSDNGGYINSNVSFYFSSGPNGNEQGIEIQGPYYDSTVCSLWKAWTGYTGGC